jgi:hypothetical protein
MLAMQVAFLVMFDIFALAIIFVLLNWLLARHVGRTFGGFRLVLQHMQKSFSRLAQTNRVAAGEIRPSMSIRNAVGHRIFQPVK